MTAGKKGFDAMSFVICTTTRVMHELCGLSGAVARFQSEVCWLMTGESTPPERRGT
jgi:hypothetical protein